MAVLTNNDRKKIWAEYMGEVSSNKGTFGTMLKADIRDAINAIDQWIDDNQTSFNNSLPEPAKTQLTAKQKVKLFMEVAKRRWEVT